MNSSVKSILLVLIKGRYLVNVLLYEDMIAKELRFLLEYILHIIVGYSVNGNLSTIQGSPPILADI
jgi:hypothetical protein